MGCASHVSAILTMETLLQFPSAWQSGDFGGIPVIYAAGSDVSIAHNVAFQFVDLQIVSGNTFASTLRVEGSER